MILEYSYDSAIKILELLKSGNIVTLSIDNSEIEGRKSFIIDYTTLDCYSEINQQQITETMLHSLPERLNTIKKFQLFLENQILNNVESFNLKFNAFKVRKCELVYDYRFKEAIASQSQPNFIEEMIGCLERFENLMIKAGVGGTETDIYFKEANNGKSKKYIKLTLAEVSEAMRKELYK